MTHMKMTRKKAMLVSVVLFFVCLIVVTLTGVWWPGIMLVFGLPLALWQYLMGRRYDAGITLLVFFGSFLTVEFNIWKIFLPVLFALGALYVVARELFTPDPETEVEKEEEAELEIEEEEK